MRQLFPLMVLLLLFCYSCEKEVIDNTDKNFPIELTSEVKGSLFTLSWTETNISTFNEYLVVRSFDSIPSSLQPSANIIVGRIDDLTESTFVDNSAPFETELHYKVYVDIGDRFLESPSVKVVQNILTFDFAAEKIIYSKEQDAFFLAQLSQGRVSRYDVASNKITHEISGITNFRDFMLGNNGGTQELYISSQSNGLITIYNAGNLAEINAFSVGREVYAMANNNRGLLFMSTDFSSESLRIIRRSDFSQAGSINTMVSSSERRLTMLNEATNELVEATSFEIMYYKIGEDGSVLEVRENRATNGTLLGKIVISPDKQNIIPYRTGTVFDTNLALKISPNIFSSSVSAFAFNSAGDKLIAGFSFFGFLQPVSFPSLIEEEFVDVSMNSVQHLEPSNEEDIIYVVGFREVGFEIVSFIRPLQF